MINKKTFHPRGRKVTSAVPPQFASLSQRTHARPPSGHTITGVPVPFYSPAPNLFAGRIFFSIILRRLHPSHSCGRFQPVAFLLWQAVMRYSSAGFLHNQIIAKIAG